MVNKLFKKLKYDYWENKFLYSNNITDNASIAEEFNNHFDILNKLSEEINKHPKDHFKYHLGKLKTTTPCFLNFVEKQIHYRAWRYFERLTTLI